jgi:chromosome segregation ATPase
MKYALCVALGAITVVCLCGWWVLDGSGREARLIADLERSRIELTEAQERLAESDRLLTEARREIDLGAVELAKVRRELGQSKAELNGLRDSLSRGSERVDESLEGIARLRAIIEGLPLLE